MKKCQIFAGFSFLNVKICFLSLSSMTVNKQSLSFELLHRRNSLKTLWDPWKLRSAFLILFCNLLTFYRQNDESINCENTSIIPPFPDSPGAAKLWTWAGTWTLASEARLRRPPLPMRSHSRVMCFLRRAVSRGRPSTGPPAWAREVAWSLELRERQLRRRWETAASQLSSQPWRRDETRKRNETMLHDYILLCC